LALIADAIAGLDQAARKRLVAAILTLKDGKHSTGPS